MKTKPSLLFGAGLLGLCTFAVCAGHGQLTQYLIAPLRGAGIAHPASFATVLASLLVHVVTSVWVLPHALRLRRLGLSADTVRIALYSALTLVFLRTAIEVGTGVIVRGLPFVGVSTALTALALVRSWPRARITEETEMRAIAGSRHPVETAERRSRAS